MSLLRSRVVVRHVVGERRWYRVNRDVSAAIDDAMAERQPRRMKELVLVRHGESEGNVAHKRSSQGDHSLYSGEFMKRHSSLWRLTEKGKEQAQQAGAWLKDHGQIDKEPFDYHYTSEFLRAMETAALMNLPDAHWFTETHCRERDWGQWDLTAQKDKSNAEEDRRKRHGLYFAPGGGESLAQVLLRVDSMLQFMHQRLHGKRVLMVCHGELMWAFRIRFERLNQISYMDMAAKACEKERIHNGCILRFSRKDPDTKELHNDFLWRQLVTPWHKDEARGDPDKTWTKLHTERTSFTNADLLKTVNRFPRLYCNSMAEVPYSFESSTEDKKRLSRMQFKQMAKNPL